MNAGHLLPFDKDFLGYAPDRVFDVHFLIHYLFSIAQTLMIKQQDLINQLVFIII